MVKESHLDGSKWDDDDIVITGISARLPNSDSVEEFQKNLLAKIDMITDEPRRFQNGLYGAIKRYGLLKDLSNFDAKFFNIHPKQAERMDPQIRNLLEVAYEATIDAGLHPEDLKGTKTGVVVGVASSETQDKWSQQPDRINGYEYTGCTRTMFANRVSYMLDLKGPSYSIDTASSTTLVAFQQAYDMIKDGVCDACFVCGTDLVLNPCVCLMFQCLNMLSPAGKCKAFDIDGDGYVRSEGAVVVLLQKAKAAKRIYANVLASGSNCDGYKDEGITFPSGPQQVKLFRKVAQLGGIDPKTIDFMEAHGSATRVGDPQEMNAVTEVFANGREKPLRTGSIKSNMGHGEPASALSAVIKICITMECGIIPPNLHYNIPNPDIPALLDGRLQVIIEPTPWEGGLVAVNSFGVGGANGHALLLSNKKIKRIFSDTIPRLICVSGVTENAVHTMLNKISGLSNDPELYALLANVHRKNIKGHEFRGYTIVDNVNLQTVQNVSRRKISKLALIFPGIEVKWKSIDKTTMDILVLKSSIKKCEKIIKTYVESIDLISLLRNFHCEKSPLNIIVGITSLQIAFTDLLRSIGLSPNYVIGRNVGEIAAGYAAGIYTLHQAITSSYKIGIVVQKSYYAATIARTDIPRRFNYPKDISVLTRISPHNTFVSGSKESIQNFVKVVSNKGFFTKEVDCFGIDIAGILQNNDCFVSLKKELEKVLTNLNNPSVKWLSYDESSSENHCQHVLNSLLVPSSFYKIMRNVSDSVKLLIGFEFLVEASDDFEKEISYSFLGESANACQILTSIGRLYNVGLQPQIENLYPKIKFPVSHGTPMIQSMIEWDHSQKWDVVSFAAKDGKIGGEIEVVIDFDKNEFNFIPKNFINKQEVFPKSFYVYLLRRAISRIRNIPSSEIPFVIENIFFLEETFIPHDGVLKFTINMAEISGRFEIRNESTIIVSGHVQYPSDIRKERTPDRYFNNADIGNANDKIDKKEFYKFLGTKQYQYNDNFRQLESGKANVFDAKTSNWCAFLETFLQISIFNSPFTENYHSTVSYIRKIIVDPIKCQMNETDAIKYHKKWNILRSSELEIRGVTLKSVPSMFPMNVDIKYCDFVPFHLEKCEQAVEISIMFALENWIGHSDLKIVEFMNESTDSLLSVKLCDLSSLMNAEIVICATETSNVSDNMPEGIKVIFKDPSKELIDNNCHIITASNALINEPLLKNLIDSVRSNGCVLLEENEGEKFAELDGMECISTITSSKKTYILLKKTRSQVNSFHITNVSNFEECRQKLDAVRTDTLVVAKNVPEIGGIFQYVKRITMESKNQIIKIVSIEDKDAPIFSLTNPLYSNQLRKNFPFNVYKNGTWGTYVSLDLTIPITISTPYAHVGLDFKKDEMSIGFVQTNSSIYEKMEKPYHIVCNICCASIVSRDLDLLEKKKSTKYSLPDIESQKFQLGTEFAGYVKDRKVFGLTAGGALSTTVIADADFVWDLPENWTMDEGCTVPGSFVMSYYALCLRTNIRVGDSILIIGDDIVAMAAIRVALHHTSNVFILASDAKRKLELEKLYPKIRSNQIVVTSNGAFYVDILSQTGSKGVDIVFVTVPTRAYKFQSYVRSIAENGHCIYVKKGPVQSLEDDLGSSSNMRCITFHRIHPSIIIGNRNDDLRRKINNLMNEGLKTGVIQPLPYCKYQFSEIQRAIKAVNENNAQKVVVNVLENLSSNSNPTDTRIVAAARTYFNSEKYYLIFGYQEEFSVYIVDWMITQGAKKLVFVASKTNDFDDGQLFKLYNEKWKSTCSITNLKMNNFCVKDVEKLLRDIGKADLLGGIFDFSQFETKQNGVIRKQYEDKINFLTAIDAATRNYCPKLEYFVSFSGMKFDELVYEYENGKIQALITKRNDDDGLSGIFVKWGSIGESTSEVIYNEAIISMPPQSVNSCLRIMHSVLQSSKSSFIVYARNETIANDEAVESKVNAILEGVAKFLGIKNPNSVSPALTMLELGLDSLIGTDIQQFLEINYGVKMCTQEIRELTFEKLKLLADTL